jgi:hypothetical protein
MPKVTKTKTATSQRTAEKEKRTKKLLTSGPTHSAGRDLRRVTVKTLDR